METALMSFSEALAFLRNGGGRAIARSGWNGKGMSVHLQVPDSGSANTLPYLWLRTVDGNRYVWLASQTDLLADDWYIAADQSQG